MDTSEGYIEMCNCHEIQNYRKGFSSGEEGELWLIVNSVQSRSGKVYVGGLWIPRLDQLQDMLKSIPWEMAYRDEKYGYMARILRDFAPWIGAKSIERTTPIHFHAPSAEQVFLELLMYELHGKKWNEKEWIK